jgi:hypothetical protein
MSGRNGVQHVAQCVDDWMRPVKAVDTSIASHLREKCLKEQLLRNIVKRFSGWLVFKAHRLLYHSTLGWRAIKKKRRKVQP